MTDYKAGDEVRVFQGGRRPGNPDDGWPGNVTRVSRKYAVAEYEWAYESIGRTIRTTATVEFDMATGHERGDTSSYGARVRTPAQVAEDRRRDEALRVVRTAGIEFRPGRAYSITLEQAEALAEVVKTWEG
jgi:hypothetical protein